MQPYLIFKAIHLLAVVLFLGNIITGLFWMRIARGTSNVTIMHHAISGIIKSDKFFTIPGVVIITAAGMTAAINGGLPLLKTGWIFWPIILFSLSGIFFGIKVAPLQKRMNNFLKKEYDPDLSRFDRIMKSWEFWGLLSLLTPVVAFFMMILKWPLISPLN
ncbi:MAG TPA: DUF2269 family protein [Chitinophagaceae bacterium]|nr:DUF2269 family protein [Chitinophagaceae bacterium]